MHKVDIIMFATENLNVYTELSEAVWKKYCEVHGYRFIKYSEKYLEDLHIAWSKIKSVENHLKTSTATSVLLVDADTIPTSFDVSVETLLELFMVNDKEILFQKDGSDKLFNSFYITHNLKNSFLHKSMVLPNAGFILMKNTKTVISFFEEWTSLAHTSTWADVPPRNQNVLTHELLVKLEISAIVGYLDTWVVNKYKGKLCRHFSSKSPKEVREMMLPYYNKLMK